MKTNKDYHVTIKPQTGTKLKFKKEEKDNNILPSNIGTLFKSKEEVKEEVLSFKEFLLK